MAILKLVGFFRELPTGMPSGPSLHAQLAAGPHADAPKILTYLRRGVLLIACPGVEADVIGNAANIAGAPHIYADGVWAWPETLSYYVEKYHVQLPDEFIQHMMLMNWEVPDRNCLNLEELQIAGDGW